MATKKKVATLIKRESEIVKSVIAEMTATPISAPIEFDAQFEKEQAALAAWRALTGSEKQTLCAKEKLGSLAEVERQLARVTNVELHDRIYDAINNYLDTGK